MLARVQALLECLRIQPQLIRSSLQRLDRLIVLVGEQRVVEFPKPLLLLGAQGRLRCFLRTAGQRVLSVDDTNFAAIVFFDLLQRWIKPTVPR